MAPDAETVPAADVPSNASIAALVDRGLLVKAYRRYSGWTHTIAITAAFVADFLHPLGDVCLYLAIGALSIALLLSVAMWGFKLRSELAVAAFILCMVTAFFGGVLVGIEHVFKTPNGAIAHLVPSVENLQNELKIVRADTSKIAENLEKIAGHLANMEAENKADPKWRALETDEQRVAVLVTKAEAALGAADFAGAITILQQAAEAAPAPSAPDQQQTSSQNVLTSQDDPQQQTSSAALYWATIQHKLGAALLARGEAENNVEILEQAANAFRSASEVYDMVGATFHAEDSRMNFARIETLLRVRRTNAAK